MKPWTAIVLILMPLSASMTATLNASETSTLDGQSTSAAAGPYSQIGPGQDGLDGLESRRLVSSALTDQAGRAWSSVERYCAPLYLEPHTANALGPFTAEAARLTVKEPDALSNAWTALGVGSEHQELSLIAANDAFRDLILQEPVALRSRTSASNPHRSERESIDEDNFIAESVDPATVAVLVVGSLGLVASLLSRRYRRRRRQGPRPSAGLKHSRRRRL